ncbi:MAG: Ldh family oxidoreductase [Gammaproteobacteria bacterium]|nr:Ldh family oxidoreductase [Gammaproteobacteria bacterium]
MQTAAEAVLDELRQCPPAPGFDRVEIPGERERDYRAQSKGIIAVPEGTWQQILALHASLQAKSSRKR